MKLNGRVLFFTQPVLVGADVTRPHEALSQLGEAYREFVPRRRPRRAPQLRRRHAARRDGVPGSAPTRLQEVIAGSLDGTARVRWSGVWGAVDPATAQVISEAVVKPNQC